MMQGIRRPGLKMLLGKMSNAPELLIFEVIERSLSSAGFQLGGLVVACCRLHCPSALTEGLITVISTRSVVRSSPRMRRRLFWVV